MAIQTGIIGLSKIGSSIGLALGQNPDAFQTVGYDHDPKIAKAAEKMGAVSKGFIALHRCVRQTQLIILACPLDDVRDVLTVIAGQAPAGAIVIDTSPNKTQVADWAKALLSEDQYFTGWTLSLNPEHLHDPGLGVAAARADLFENSLIGINDPPGTPERVLNFSRYLVGQLGAHPLLVDSIEADGLIALGQELPRVAALALLLATVDAPGWLEGRKFAGPDYAKGSLPILSVNEREDLGLSLRLNRENVVRVIDDLIQSLQRVRGYIDSDEEEVLRKALDHAVYQRLLWVEQRKKRAWGPAQEAEQTDLKPPSFLGGWLEQKIKRGKGE